MEVVLLNVLDRVITVAVVRRDGYASFQSKVDSRVSERVSGKRFSAGHFDLSALVAVVLGPGGNT